MANVFEFKGQKPVIHQSAFVHPSASIIGNVVIGKNVYVGSGASIRGDLGRIIIKDGCNVQENCIIHMFPGETVLLNEGAHIGHGAIIHGATIGKNVLIGMNSVIMDNVIIGDNSIVGALTLVPENMKIPRRKVVVGSPAKTIKDVTDAIMKWKTEGTAIYQRLTDQCNETLVACQPLRKIKKTVRGGGKAKYKTWKQTRN